MASPAATRQTTARERVLHVARRLFSEYGVSGTSLQRIADHLSVTKAAVYHQFHTKDEIILALLEKPMAEMEALLALAEAAGMRESQLDVLLKGLVDIVLANPDVVGMLQGDPTVVRLVQNRQSYSDIVARLDKILVGPTPDPATRIAGAIFGAGLLLIGHHLLLRDIDLDAARRELPRIGLRLLLSGAED